MPSPFPGMDPFIEGQVWQGFHTRFITALGDALVPLVLPKYLVDVETYVFLGPIDEPPERVLGPDVYIAERNINATLPEASTVAGATLTSPITMTMAAWPNEFKQHYLTIRSRQNRKLVTVLKLLSPWNKSPGDGETEYEVKRQNVLAGMTHLVELDLLRGGNRLKVREPLPAWDYFAFVFHWQHPARVEAYGCDMRHPLPTIAVPLQEDDPDVRLDLQQVFNGVYERSGYSALIDYFADVVPPLVPEHETWIRKQITPAS